MTEPISRWSAVQMIGKGVEAAPALRRGIGATFGLAMVGSGGRVVVQSSTMQHTINPSNSRHPSARARNFLCGEITT